MEDINIPSTDKTPRVHFQGGSGDLLIEGISIPEDTVDFYHSLIYWLTEYAQKPSPKTTLVLNLAYFNTSTSVVLLNIFKALSQVKDSEILVEWHFESDDPEMEEVGRDYERVVDLKFEMVSREPD